VAIEVEDRPGGLARVLEVLEGARINVEYVYAFTRKQGDRAVLVFRFAEPDAAIEALRAAGVGVLDAEEVAQRM
jgi:hypothetical protein